MEEILSLLILLLLVASLFVLANLAESNRNKAELYSIPGLMSYLILLVLYGVFFFAGLDLAYSSDSVLLNELPNILNSEIDINMIESRRSIIGNGLWIPALFGILLLVPFVRRVVALFINIDPQSPVHAVALSITMLVVIQLLITLGIGLENLAGAVSASNESVPDDSGLDLIATLWVQQLGTAFIGLVGIGWMIRRNWSASLKRLGITPLTSEQLKLGIGLGLIMVPIVMLLEFASRTLLGIGADPNVEALTEELLGPLMRTPLGVLTIGLAAAIGEETIFRGAAQPRFGLLLTAIIFAIVHSNYGLSTSTAIVFVLGLVLGYVRIRHNTTTAMVIHAVYNSTLGSLAYLSIQFLE